MDNKQRQLIKKYADLLIMGWRIIAACLLIAISCGLAIYLKSPKVYRSTALLSYEQNVPGSMQSGGRRLPETLPTVKEKVLSRSSLEKLIKDYALYVNLRQRMPMEEITASLRKDIDVVQGGGDVFTVSFRGSNPDQVAKVTNALAAMFVEQSLSALIEEATERRKNLQEQLDNAKKVIDRKQAAMRDYKLEHYNEMPEQRANNIARLQMLQTEQQSIQTSIQELERTKVLIQEQVSIRRRTADTAHPGDKMKSAEVQAGNDCERLQRLYTLREELRTKYTQRHPDVLLAERRIKALEKTTANQCNKPEQASFSSRSGDLEESRLNVQLQQLDENIKQLREQQKRLPTEIAKYQQWIDAAPIREAEWASLTRDYDEINRNYNQLLAKFLEAQANETIALSQRGSKFKVVDPGRYSEKPFSPDFLRILLSAMGIALAVSAGFILVRDFLDTSFKDPSEIESYLGVPVICAIPYVSEDNELRRKRVIFLINVGVFSFLGFILLVIIIYLLSKELIII